MRRTRLFPKRRCQTLTDQQEEITRLRAEVKRLTAALHDAEAIGDFALELRDRLALKEGADAAWNRVRELEHERDEALAQVAVLTEHIRRTISGNTRRLDEDVIAQAPDEAQILLDRLQRAEAVVKAVAKQLPSKGLRGGPDQLGCGIGIWIDPDPLFTLLAAWEAGKETAP